MTEPAEGSPKVGASTSGKQQRLPANVRLLGVTSLINDISSEMIFPLLPRFFLTVLGGSETQLGLIEGFADSIASILKLFSGGWSDRAGTRKPFVVFGYALASAARPLLGLATTAWHVAAVRASDRIGKGIRSAPRDALIADATDPAMRGRAYGFNRAMDHLGAAIGPLLAFAFLKLFPGDPENIRWLFVAAIVPGVIVTVLVAFALRPQPMQSQAGKPFSLSLKPFDRDFKVYLAALVLFTLGNSSDAFLLVRSGELGVSDAALPLLWCAFHVVKSVGNVCAGRAVDRLGSRRLIVAGWLIYGLIYVGFAFAENAWQAWACFLIYGLFFALTEPAEKTMVANLVGPELKGLAFGWFNFAIGIAALPASVLFGFLYQHAGPLAAFGTGAGLAAAATVLLAMVGTTRPTVSSRI